MCTKTIYVNSVPHSHHRNSRHGSKKTWFAMKRVKTFADCDDVGGWTESARDERLWKYIRPHDMKVANIKMDNTFLVVEEFKLPPSFLVDPFQIEKGSTIDRGDIYEAFWRTSNVSIRGVFANGEPVWGTAQYRNGMSYTGMFSACLPDGFGEKRARASVFAGRFKNGMRHGRGLFVDASHFRLYLGPFSNDLPHGVHLCITFRWSASQKRVTHTRNTLMFEKGILVQMSTNANANVVTLSGLCYEEFLKYYREAEKATEDFMARKRLADMGAEEFLWQPVRSELYPNATGDAAAESKTATVVKQEIL